MIVYRQLSQFFTLVSALEHSSQRSASAAHQEDRTLALQGKFSDFPAEMMLHAWANSIADQENQQRGHYLARWYRGVLILLLLAGLLFGALLSGGVFYYDGSAPVNIILVLGVLVVLPLPLVFLSLLAMLPQGILGRLPFFTALQQALLSCSPGMLLRVLARYGPQSSREQYQMLLGNSLRNRILYGAITSWSILYAGQVFAVSFYLGVLLRAFYFIVFSDLAFTWSTTLAVASEEFYSLIRWVVKPWEMLIPTAVPTLELIEGSRYYRLHSGSLHLGSPSEMNSFALVDPSRLGLWWPFLLACITFYGFLPRCLLLLAAHVAFRRSLKKTSLMLPGAQEAIARMRTEIVDLSSGDLEVSAANRLEGARTPTSEFSLPIGSTLLISWAQLPHNEIEEALMKSGLKVVQTYSIDNTSPLGEESRILELLANSDTSSNIVLVSRLWEPPTAEVLDFLGMLREKLKQGRMVYVLPLPQSAFGYPADPRTAVNSAVWAKRIATIGDPWLRYLEFPEEEQWA